MFLGDDLLPWLVLALGAALAVGNLLALVRPAPPVEGSEPDPQRLDRAPVGRALALAAIGAAASIWAIATLAS